MAGDPAIDNVTQSAQNWIDSLTSRNQWRLQIISQRYRIDPDTGDRVPQPVRIRRFAEGCPGSGIKQAIDYLLSKAPYTGVIFNGQTLDGTYVPTQTTWSRDDREIVSTIKGRTDGTYTIVQDLIDRTYADEYEILSQSSCSEEATTTYVWESGSIEAIQAGGIGDTYAVQAVSRNDDGTFNYQLVHRRAKTQHLQETVTENSLLKWASVEYWDNVYPGPGGTYLDENGEPLPIPAPGSVGGVEIKVANININQDCTLRVQVTRERNNAANVRQQSTHTIYEGNHEEDATGALVPLPLAPDATGGVIHTNESRLQPDGRYEVRKEQRIERAVPQSNVEVRVGAKGRRVTTVSTNQATPASTTGIAVGGSVRVEKTPGGLYNNTVSVWDRSAPLAAGERCEDDLFGHTDARTTSGISEIPSDHVAGGTGGRVVTRRTDMDDDGAITQVLETKQEKNVEGADEEWSVSLDGVTHRVTHRYRDPLNKGTAPAFSIQNVGKSVRNEKTPGGLVTVTLTELDRNSAPLKVSDECSKTIYEHVDQGSTTNPNGTVPADGHVTDAGGGSVYEKSSRLNANGSVTVVEKRTQELTVEDAQLSFRRTARGLITTRQTRNGQTPASDPGASAVGCSKSHDRTPGGRYNLTEVTLTASKVADSARCRKTWFEHEHDAVTMDTGTVDSTDVADAGNGISRLKTSDLDNDGFVKTVVRTTTEITRASAEVSYRRTSRGLITTTVDRNTTTPAEDPGDSAAGNSQSHTTTDGGRYNLTKVVLKASEKPDSAYCSRTWFEHVHDAVKMSRGAVDSSEAAAAGSGVRRTKTSDIDNDGFVKTVVRTITEIPRTGAELSYRRTTRGLITTTVDRSTSEAASDPGESAVGCSRTHRMTEGGLYDLTKVDITASEKVDSAYCSKTMFEHTHDEVKMGTGDVDSTDVADAGSGIHRVKTSDLDNDGFVKTVVRSTTEIARTSAELSYRRTARGLITTTTDRNVTTTAQDPGESAVGCSQAHRMNPGGTYDFTKVELTSSERPDSAYCSKTLFEHVHDEVSMDTGDVDDSDVEDAGSGLHRIKTSELDNDGFVKTTVRTTTELAVSDYRVEYDSDHFTKTRRIIDRNVDASETEKDYVQAGANRIVSVSVEKTAGGKKVKTETTTDATYRHWDQEVSLNLSYVKTVWFVNATEAEKNSLYQQEESAFKSKLLTWGDERKPGNYGCNPNVTLNKFGTFDGSFSFHASWSPESAGQEDELDKFYSNFEYDRYTISHNPYYNDGKAYIRTEKIVQHVYHEVGRGKIRYENLCSGLHLFSLDASIDPITKRYAVTKITSQTVYITYEMKDDGTADVTEEDNIL